MCGLDWVGVGGGCWECFVGGFLGVALLFDGLDDCCWFVLGWVGVGGVDGGDCLLYFVPCWVFECGE